ncbi:MAG: aminopeptidase [Anaerolineales bacterium]
MPDPRLTRLAQTLVNYCVAVQPNEWVLLRADVAAMPLVNETLQHILLAGGLPTVQLSHESLEETLLRTATENQLQWVDPIETTLFNEVDCLISIRASENTRALTGIAPSQQRTHQKARAPLMQTYMRRSAEGKLRWVSTQFPTAAYAQDADLSLRDYEDFVYRATFCDQPDPVAAWQQVHNEQQRLVEWLRGKKSVKVRGPHVNLSLSIEGRTFINSDGRHNMPSGEIFTGPVETSANGWVRFTYPAVRGGREVEGVELFFENGRVINAKAEKNQDYLLSQLDSDPGARYLGEFAIGTNYGIDRFTKSILFDEKIGGTFHMAVGAGYPETGSVNQSSVHWDFICDMRHDSEITIDGELFYKNGQFTI